MDAEATARQHIEPFHPLIRRIFAAAEALWRELPEKHRGIIMMSKRTHANVMWQFIVHEASNEFASTHVVAKAGNNTITFSIGNEVVMRFKKINGKGLSNNFQTQRSLDFNLQLVLPDMPESMRVDVGWVPDDTTFAIRELRVVQRDGANVAWQYTIPQAEEGESGGSAPIPVAGAPAGPAPSRVRVVAPAAAGKDEDVAAGA